MGSVLWIVISISLFAATYGAPLQLHEPSSSYTDAVLPSVCVLVVMLVILLNCTNVGGCCLKIFGKDRSQDADASMVFNNPIADDNPRVSPIDISGMELNPITFEPLPGVQHLTPESSQLFNELPRFNTNRPLRTRNAKNNENLIYSPGFPGLIHGNAGMTSELTSCDWFDEPFRNFPRSNVEFVSDVGPGWFGNVVEAIAEDIVPYSQALKVNVKVLRDNADTAEKLKFLKEAQFFRDANHENIVKVLGHCIEKDPFLLIFEYFPVDLKSYLMSCVSKPDSLTSSSFHIQAALDIALGLEYMAQLDFIHPDLAARNCLVSSEGRIVIGDYGLAVRTHSDDYYWNSGLAIPLRWAAPETIKFTMNTIQTLTVEKSSNIWNLAVTMWELCEFGKLPYPDISDKQVISLLISEQLCLKPPSRAGLLMKTEMNDLIQQCLNFKPEYRPQISTIVTALKDLMRLSFSKPSPRNILSVRERNEDFEKKWEDASPKSKAELISLDRNLRPTESALHRKSVSFSDDIENNLESATNNCSELSNLKIPSASTKHESLNGNARSSNMNNNFLLESKVRDGTVGNESRSSHSDQSRTSYQNSTSLNANSSNSTSQSQPHATELRNDSMSGCVSGDADAEASSFFKAHATQLQQSSVNVEVSSASHSKSGIQDKLAVKRSARTSTPTGSPFCHPGLYSKGNSSGNSEVFEEEFTMNISESVSPINSDTDSSNVVMGPSEELGLEPFQKVSSEVSEGLEVTTGETSSCVWETFEETVAPSIPEQAGKSGFLDIFSGSENGPTPRQPTPFRFSLQSARENEKNDVKVAKKLLFSTIDTETSEDALVAKAESWNPTAGVNAHQCGFERDIIQATEELSSLVLQDLENESDEVTLIKETVVEHSPRGLSRLSSIMFETSEDNSVVQSSSTTGGTTKFNSSIEKFAVHGHGEVNADKVPFGFPQQSTSTSHVLADQFSSNSHEKETVSLSEMSSSMCILQQSSDKSEVGVDQFSSNSDEEGPPEDTTELCKNFVPSTWDQKLEPKKPALKSPEVSHYTPASISLLDETQSSAKSSMKKSVSFERKRPPVVYQYPPPIVSDSEDDDRNIPSAASNLLDWELQPDELAPEDNTDDADIDFAVPRQRRQIMDVYSISGIGSSPVDSDSGHAYEADSMSSFPQSSVQLGSSESNTLGVLRHTRGKLKLDLPNSLN